MLLFTILLLFLCLVLFILIILEITLIVFEIVGIDLSDDTYDWGD